MKVKKFLKSFGNIRVHVHGSDPIDTVVCDSSEIKDTTMADRTVKSVCIRNFRKYDDRLDDYFVIQGLDIEVEDESKSDDEVLDEDIKQTVSEYVDDNGKKFVKIFTILYNNILTSQFVLQKEFLDLKDTDVITIEGSEDGCSHSDFNIHIDLDKKNFKELTDFGRFFNFTRVLRVEDRDFDDREPNNISYICLTTNQCVFAIQDLMRKIPVVDVHDKTLRGLSKLVNIHDYEVIEIIYEQGIIHMTPSEYEYLFKEHIQGDSLEYLKVVESDKFHVPLKIYLDENNFRDTAHAVYVFRSREDYPFNRGL